MSDDAPATNLYTALLNAQRSMGKVIKNATNPHLKSKYADLGSVLDTIEQPLWDNGLLIAQRFTHDQGGAILVTELIHAASGERLTSEVPVVSKDPTDPQKIGAAITYYRRYSLLALLGLAPEDDDGHAASQPRPQPVPARSQAARPTPPAAAPRADDQGSQRATERQVKFIWAIGAEAGLPEAEIEAWSQQLYRGDVDQLNRRDAATFIEALQRRRNEVTQIVALPTPPVVLTDEQEKVIAQAWDMAEAHDGYPAVIALIRTLRAAATPEQWGAIKEAGHQIQLKHYAPASIAG